MAYENISVTLVQQDIADVKAALGTINSKLPWLVTLSPDEIRGLTKLGPKSIDFVQDAKMATESFPAMLPGTFDAKEFHKDTAAFQALSEIKILVDSLKEKIDNTYSAVGSEAMTQALEVYAYVQTGKDRVPGLKSVAEKLKDRFRRNAQKKAAS
jgi:hypothetical protein